MRARKFLYRISIEKTIYRIENSPSHKIKIDQIIPTYNINNNIVDRRENRVNTRLEAKARQEKEL